jgi:hypothetical protein
MALTLAQRFGTGAAISGGNLTISLDSLKDSASGGDIEGGIGLGAASPSPDQIAAALLVLWKQNQPATNDDPTVGVYVEEGYKQFVTRDTEEQLAYVFPTGIYIPDPTANLDPDDVV